MTESQLNIADDISFVLFLCDQPHCITSVGFTQQQVSAYVQSGPVAELDANQLPPTIKHPFHATQSSYYTHDSKLLIQH